MSNTISCPSCQRTLRVPDDLLGQLVKCPRCGQTFTAELGEPPPPPPEPAPERERDEDERPRRRSARREDEDEEGPRRPARWRDEYDDEDEDRPRRRRRRLQDHRGAMILTFGIVSFFFMPLIFGPLAWILGSQDLKEIRAGRMDPEGQSATETGRLCGMIATLLWGVFVLGCCAFYALIFGAASAGSLR
jgi:predicted Zn finger-like uncharacterized protein